MENISIAVITDNTEYGRAFGLSILNIYRSFIISIFNKDEFLDRAKAKIDGNSYAAFGRQYDLILWDGKEVQDIYRGNIVFMTEKPAFAVKNFYENKYSIYKYDPAQDMVGSILEIYSVLTGSRPVNVKKDNVRLFAFCSAEGGSGCTTLAMAEGQELSRFYGKKVIYLSFENLESTGDFMECRSGVKPLGYYLYNLFRKNYGIDFFPNQGEAGQEKMQAGFLESYVIKDDFGMEAFAPTMGRNPLNDMNENETLTFFSSIIETGRYDVVIADLGSSLSTAALSCAEMSEKICFVSGRGKGMSREEQYLQYMICRFGEKITERVIKIKNMAGKGQTAYSCEKEQILGTDIYIAKHNEFVYEGNVKKILLENEFENKIRQLSDMIMEPIHKLNITLT